MQHFKECCYKTFKLNPFSILQFLFFAKKQTNQVYLSNNKEINLILIFGYKTNI